MSDESAPGWTYRSPEELINAGAEEVLICAEHGQIPADEAVVHTELAWVRQSCDICPHCGEQLRYATEDALVARGVRAIEAGMRLAGEVLRLADIEWAMFGAMEISKRDTQLRFREQIAHDKIRAERDEARALLADLVKFEQIEVSDD